jgi:protein-disulfide isomerase
MAKAKKTPVKKSPKKAETTARKTLPSLAPTVAPSTTNKTVEFLKENLPLVLIFLIVFFLGFFVGSLYKENSILKGQTGLVGTATDTTAEPTPDYEKIPEVTAEDHQRGNKDAAVTLIEYSDYECPYCNRFHPVMLELMEKYGDKVNWVYRHFPLSFHPNAQKLAEASECVAKYGSEDAFWKFSDAVFTAMNEGSIYTGTGTTITDDTILRYASEAGANRNSVQTCLTSAEMADKVKEQQNIAQEAGISGTPNTIILSKKGNQVIPAAYPIEDVEAMIDSLL